MYELVIAKFIIHYQALSKLVVVGGRDGKSMLTMRAAIEHGLLKTKTFLYGLC